MHWDGAARSGCRADRRGRPVLWMLSPRSGSTGGCGLCEGLLLALTEYADVADLERVAVELGQSGEPLAVVRQSWPRRPSASSACRPPTARGAAGATVGRTQCSPAADSAVRPVDAERPGRGWVLEPAVEVSAVLLEHLPHSRTAGQQVRVDQAWADAAGSLCPVYRRRTAAAWSGCGARPSGRRPATWPTPSSSARTWPTSSWANHSGTFCRRLRPDRDGLGWSGDLAGGPPTDRRSTTRSARRSCAMALPSAPEPGRAVPRSAQPNGTCWTGPPGTPATSVVGSSCAPHCPSAPDRRNASCVPRSSRSRAGPARRSFAGNAWWPPAQRREGACHRGRSSCTSGCAGT